MNELRASDLRFSPNETSEFLKSTMQLDLSPENIKLLEDRTEGWIAGLQLAALSMKNRKNINSFIQSFSGNNRYVPDYLVDEVLENQTKETKAFLLQTSFLDQMNASLCNSITGTNSSQTRLEELEKLNMFIIDIQKIQNQAVSK